MNFFKADGVRLAYRVDGPDDAPTLVLLNSLGTDLRMWDRQVAAFSRTLRIIRYDYPGHGSSDAPTRPYTLERLGLDLLALFDRLGIERAHICGLSLGGMVAQWFAASSPDRLSRAVFANTAARIGTRESWDARIEAVRTGGMRAIRDMVLARFLSEGFRRSHPEVAQQFGEMLEATNPVGYIEACAALGEADLRTRLAGMHTPSLIIAGELDVSTPPSQARELHAGIPGSELLVLKAAHLSNVEQPEQFSKAVLDFLVRS